MGKGSGFGVMLGLHLSLGRVQCPDVLEKMTGGLPHRGLEWTRSLQAGIEGEGGGFMGSAGPRHVDEAQRGRRRGEVDRVQRVRRGDLGDRD